MAESKHYVVDTNVLLEDPGALLKLRNGNENRVYIPYHVLLELDRFKKNPKLAHMVTRVVSLLSRHPDQFTVLNASRLAGPFADMVDNHILDEVRENGIENPILVTNDRFLQFRAGLRGIRSETYRESAPFKSEAEYFTGFVKDPADAVPNCFLWSDQGRPVFLGPDGEKTIDYQHRVWNVIPRNVYQNLALELMLHPAIPIVSSRATRDTARVSWPWPWRCTSPWNARATTKSTWSSP